jgi:ABC-type multidrug transport system permease subunit
MFIFPLSFIANTFVIPQSMPAGLRQFAYWNPVSAVAQSVREAFGNISVEATPDAWSLQNPVLYSLIWIGIIMAIFIPLSMRAYKKAAARAG